MRDKKSKASEAKKQKYREIKGTHCYDILANEQYQKDFQYFSPHLDDARNDFIKDDDDDEGNDAIQSDFVKVMLNLAFYSENDLKSLTTSGVTIYKKDPESFSLFNKNQTGFTGIN
jgi:hypothetical protein